jgi:formyl-CoA transferase
VRGSRTKAEIMSAKALAGVKVVDFGWVLVSPLTVKLLGDYGATAICVESPQNPGINRMGTPFKDGKPGVDRAGHFAYCAPNKLSISVDFRNPYGMEICRKLVAWADGVWGSTCWGWVLSILVWAGQAKRLSR